jgi:hypothetical protein
MYQIFGLQQGLVISEKFGIPIYFAPPCNNPDDYRMSSARCDHMNIYIFLLLHLILLMFRDLVEKLMVA